MSICYSDALYMSDKNIIYRTTDKGKTKKLFARLPNHETVSTMTLDSRILMRLLHRDTRTSLLNGFVM